MLIVQSLERGVALTAQDCRCVALDLAGHGLSGKGADFSLPEARALGGDVARGGVPTTGD
jgi:pimeloyl-ACP methyl ester carboxylesterase